MKCYCIRYMLKGDHNMKDMKEIFVVAMSMYEALYDWQAFDICSVELMGEAR